MNFSYAIAAILLLLCGGAADAADVFVRFKIVDQPPARYRIQVAGYRHEDPWYLPTASIELRDGGAWSDWFDASKWPLHGKLARAGVVAEWPTMTAALVDPAGVKGCTFEVQIADKPDEKSVVHTFIEKTGSNTIAFLLPTPLREQAKEFETGSQMTARHFAWAKSASRGEPARLKHFTFLTALWGHYDPLLARQAVETLKMLGINVVGNYDSAALSEAGVRTYQTTWMYNPDPAVSDEQWKKHVATALSTDAARKTASEATHFVIGDELMTLDFRGVDAATLNGWFRDYLRACDVRDDELPTPIEKAEYPAKAMFEKTLPRDADLPTRRLMYHAGKFGHWWSAKQLRHSSDLVRGTLPAMKTETLPSDHGFFHAWGPPHIGMSYRMFDLFELGAQRSVDEISAEDWLGLNHMYGPAYTWTGAQSFAYFNAICRSAMQHAPGEPVMLRSLITPSDDKYLRLKAYSTIGQGSKSLFFWTFGPTYIGTENYWSDLRSEYDGIAKLSRAVAKAENVLHPATPVRDPVAVLYSVSHDLWHSDDPAAFVEKRLLWHALRHLHVQPDFLREEEVEAGRLKDYKVLYVADWCVSRAASAKIDEWVKAGGVVYLSAGAATRDEFYEPYVPTYAANVWPADATKQFRKESYTYNERVDLPTIKPMTAVQFEDASEVPVLGCRQPLKRDVAGRLASFEDGSPAAAMSKHGDGKVIALGFMPMLAYGQGAGFKPTTLEEKWPPGPRQLIQRALDAAGVTPVAACDHPVVETSLLAGPKGAVLVLVNYTYQPIRAVTVDVRLDQPIGRAVSTEGREATLAKMPDGRLRVRVPLEWTDMILLH